MSLQSQFNRPEQRKAPLRTNQASQPQRQFTSAAPARSKAPLRTNQQKTRPPVRPQPLSRSFAGRREMLARRELLLSYLTGPAPSPDRTTGREQAGFSSAAFTKPWFQLMNQKNNGFTPSPAAGKLLGYGTQAGNPKQQKFASDMQFKRGPLAKAAAALGASPIGEVAGDIQANRTWAKLAPLFQRDPKKPPEVTFGNTGPKAIGLAFGGKVKLDPSLLDNILLGGKRVAQTAAHEYAHTQQPAGGYSNSGGKAKREGGARAFENAVAPLLGYKPRSDGQYQRWANQYFTTPGTMSAYNPRGTNASPNLAKILIGQFPRASKRLTPIKARRVNLAK